MAILTASVYKARSGITANDARITPAIASAEMRIARMLGYKTLDATTFTDEPHTGDGSASLRLRLPGISSVTAVKVQRGDGTTTINASAYRIAGDDLRLGVLTLEGFTQGPYHDDDPFTAANRIYGSGPGWPRGPDKILVSCVGGYTDETDCPPDLLDAITMMTSEVLESQRPAGVDVSSGGVSANRRPAAERIATVRQYLDGWGRGGEFAA